LEERKKKALLHFFSFDLASMPNPRPTTHDIPSYYYCSLFMYVDVDSTRGMSERSHFLQTKAVSQVKGNPNFTAL
jgi:hypothetical protein